MFSKGLEFAVLERVELEVDAALVGETRLDAPVECALAFAAEICQITAQSKFPSS